MLEFRQKPAASWFPAPVAWWTAVAWLAAAASLAACGGEDPPAAGPADVPVAVDQAGAEILAPDQAVADTVADAVEVSQPECKVDADCGANGPCDQHVCDPAAGCVVKPKPDGVACTSSDPCLGGGTCAAGVCSDVKAKDCSDANPCTDDACTDGTCSHTPLDGQACDDGDACSSGETCVAGVCKGTCPCATDADCKDDGDLCNGLKYCDKSGTPFVCVLNPKTVVTCPAQTSPCLANACNPATGACASTPVVDATPCEDGSPCTTGDACVGGVC